MNLIEIFQDLVAEVPELVRPIIIALAAVVPYIEGEGAVTIGILGGMNPVVAAIAATVGSFMCVFVVVLLSARARHAIITRRRRSHPTRDEPSQNSESARRAARRAKFQRAFDRYGVPGVSLFGPLLLPPAFTAPMLIALGIDTTRVLVWQGIGIILWVVALSILSSIALSAMH